MAIDVLMVMGIGQRRYDIRAPLCAFHVIKIILNVQSYMGAWAWNVKIMM